MRLRQFAPGRTGSKEAEPIGSKQLTIRRYCQ